MGCGLKGLRRELLFAVVTRFCVGAALAVQELAKGIEKETQNAKNLGKQQEETQEEVQVEIQGETRRSKSIKVDLSGVSGESGESVESGECHSSCVDPDPLGLALCAVPVLGVANAALMHHNNSPHLVPCYSNNNSSNNKNKNYNNAAEPQTSYVRAVDKNLFIRLQLALQVQACPMPTQY